MIWASNQGDRTLIVDVPPQDLVARLTQELDCRLPDNDLVCIACGCGDCTVGHWVRWFIVPIVAAHRLLGLRRYIGHLDEVSRLSQRSLTVCSLVVFHFRRLLRQAGGFHHQTRGERHSPVWWCRRICQEVSLNAHVQLHIRLEEDRRSALACTCTEDGFVMARTLPVHLSTFLRPSVVLQAAQNYDPGDTIAKVRLNSVALAALQATEGGVQGNHSNVTTSYYLCRCGAYHVSVAAISAIAKDDLLTIHAAQPPVMFAQFDGSAHSQIGVGGAGAALFLVSYRGLEQLWTASCKSSGGEPHLLHAIQGDIKPLLQHLQFTGRLRRSDLISTIDDFHQARSLIAPSCQLLYRPREVNFIADFLAGQGSRFLLDLHRRGQVFLFLQKWCVDGVRKSSLKLKELCG